MRKYKEEERVNMKYLKVLLAFIIIFNLGTLQAGAQTFKDVPNDHWASDEIQFLTNKRVIKGFSNGTFKPTAILTRKDAAVMMVRAMQLPINKNPKIKPRDMKPTMGGYAEIVTAVNKGIFPLSNQQFNPNQQLSREDMARALALAYNYQGKGQSTFRDLAKSNPYYKYIDAIAENGITTGYSDGTFKPKVGVNRAQFSTFLKRVYDRPHVYTVKQSGKVLATFRGEKEAIDFAVKNPNSTVHPNSNSLMKYSNKPANLAATGITNGALIYNGAENLNFTPELYKPYLTNGEHKLFDTFIILGRTYAGGEFQETARNKANYQEWQWYSNQTFAEDGALETLNKAAAAENQKAQVYIAIPYPKRNEAIVNLTGGKVPNTLAAREQLVNWYISTVEAKWKKANYSHLTFKGYYWLNETVIHAEDEQLVAKTAKNVHRLQKKFIYSPHALATHTEKWQEYGFDGAYIQPNTFRLKLGDPSARLHKAFLEAQIKGTGITLEIDSYSPHQMVAGLPNFEKYLDFANLYGLKGQSLLLYQGTDMVYRMGTYPQESYQTAYRKLGELLK